MTTQNFTNAPRLTFQNLTTAAGPYYAPVSTGARVAGNTDFTAVSNGAWIDMDGFDHLSIMTAFTCGAANTIELTIWSDDGVSAIFGWHETPGTYESTTNAFAASWIAPAGATTYWHFHLDDCNGKRFQVKLVIVDGGAVSNTGSITFRRTKV
jgi:hypothetical protein